jgi:hypothetical protein
MFLTSNGMFDFKRFYRLVWVANGTIIPSTSARLVKSDTGYEIVLILKDVLAVLELKQPLITVAAFLNTRINMIVYKKEMQFLLKKSTYCKKYTEKKDILFVRCPDRSGSAVTVQKLHEPCSHVLNSKLK